MRRLHHEVASGIPIMAASARIVAPDAEGLISPTGRIEDGCGTLSPGIARVGGAAAGSPGMPGCGGGAPPPPNVPWGNVPSRASRYRLSASRVGAIDPPPAGNGRHPVHG